MSLYNAQNEQNLTRFRSESTSLKNHALSSVDQNQFPTTFFSETAKPVLPQVTPDSDIDWAKFEDFSWIRCSGKGNFLSSPNVKACAEHCLAHGARCIVVDLSTCSGMDSTFMGMLAGLAMRITKQTGGGRLEIADSGEKNLASLEDLGLDAFMEINPSGALWNSCKDEIRSKLDPWKKEPTPPHERGKLVLEAHKTLSATSAANAKKFENVVNLLEKEIKPDV